MSHFTVLVIGENPEDQLAPFHEFECTGQNDQYIQSIDITEEAREEFNDATTTVLKDAEGNEHQLFIDGAYNPRFWSPAETDPQKILSSRREKILPEGFVEVEVPTSTRKTFAEWAKGWYGKELLKEGELPNVESNDAHKYGWIKVNEAGEVLQIVKRTNPNAKWDWYQLGGRWTGFWKLKVNVLRGMTTRAELGHPGILTEQKGRDEDGDALADAARKCDINFDKMREIKRKQAAKDFDEFNAVTVGFETKGWSYFQGQAQAETITIDEARKLYAEQDGVKAWKAYLAKHKRWGWDCDFDRFSIGRDAYIQQQADEAIMTFAVLKDGVWSERGNMGWFAMVSNEVDRGDWTREFNKLVDSLPEDTMLSIYDCHI